MDAELKMYFGPPGTLTADFGADPAGPQAYEARLLLRRGVEPEPRYRTGQFWND